MLTAQINIALQVVATLSETERERFMPELAKLTGWKILPTDDFVVASKPRKKRNSNPFNIPPKEILVQMLIEKHKARHSTASKTCISP